MKIYPIQERLEFAKEKIIPETEKIILQNYDKPMQLLSQSDNTVQTDIDVEDKAIELIQAKYKSDCIIAEERAKKKEIINPKGEYVWTMDLLDGSTNYRKQNPQNHFFSTSIAVTNQNNPYEKGGIISAPKQEKLFFTDYKQRAYLEDRKEGTCEPMKVSSTKSLRLAKISTVSLHSFEKNGKLDLLRKIQKEIKDDINTGCTALSFAYTAMGIYDGVVKPTKNKWGALAGAAIVEAAHGAVTVYREGDLNIYVASNLDLHRPLCDIVAKSLGEKAQLIYSSLWNEDD